MIIIIKERERERELINNIGGRNIIKIGTHTGVFKMPPKRLLSHYKVDAQRNRLLIMSCNAEDMLLPTSHFTFYGNLFSLYISFLFLFFKLFRFNKKKKKQYLFMLDQNIDQDVDINYTRVYLAFSIFENSSFYHPSSIYIFAFLILKKKLHDTIQFQFQTL